MYSNTFSVEKITAYAVRLRDAVNQDERSEKFMFNEVPESVTKPLANNVDNVHDQVGEKPNIKDCSRVRKLKEVAIQGQ